MNPETLTQRLAIMDVFNYAAVTNQTITSLGIDMSKVTRAIWILSGWTSTAGTGTLDARLQGSANSNFTGNTNISGTNITQLTTNNTTTSVEIRSDQLASLNLNYRYVRLSVTGATNAFTASGVGLGCDSIQSPGSQFNLNTTFVTPGTVCSL